VRSGETRVALDGSRPARLPARNAPWRRVATMSAPDPVHRPSLLVGEDTNGNVIWEGTQRELNALQLEVKAAGKEVITGTLLFPALAVTAAGAGVVIVDLVRTRRARSPIPDHQP